MDAFRWKRGYCGPVKILITGGTGFVGGEIVRQALDAGHEVRVLSRGRKLPDACPGRVDLVRGSVLDPGVLPAAMAGVDAVLHLVGIISEIGDQTFERVHVLGTRHVVSAARAAGVNRFIHMSALGTRPEARSRYHQSKWAAEEIVRNSGLEWTVFRPGLIYGPGDAFVNLFARLARVSPVIPVIGPGNNLLQPVAVQDVARCFVGALTVHGSQMKTLDLCGRERFTMDEVLDVILGAVQRRRLRVHLPWGIARLMAGVMEKVFPALLGKAPPLNRDQVCMLQEDNVGDPDPLCGIFGIDPVRFRAGVREFLQK